MPPPASICNTNVRKHAVNHELRLKAHKKWVNFFEESAFGRICSAGSSSASFAASWALIASVNVFESLDPSLNDKEPDPNFNLKKHFSQIFTNMWVNVKSMSGAQMTNTAFIIGLERIRGKKDTFNDLAGGALSGAALAVRGGPKSMVLGAAVGSVFVYGMSLFARLGAPPQ